MGRNPLQHGLINSPDQNETVPSSSQIALGQYFEQRARRLGRTRRIPPTIARRSTWFAPTPLGLALLWATTVGAAFNGAYTRGFGIFLPIVLAAIVVWSGPSSATSVMEVSVDDALEKSAFVFEGQVIGVEQSVSRRNRLPRTCVRFEVLEVVKGSYTDPTVDLCFLGGRSGNNRLVIAEMQYPEPGERGIYFVESLQRQQVHPLYGWSQGHFLLEREGSAETARVTTANRRPVRDVLRTERRSSRALSTGIARGVVAGQRGQMSDALSAREFKSRLRSMLRSGRR